MTIFKCEWNNHTSHLEALSLSDAERKFEEKYGFYPSEEIVSITRTKLRVIE